MLVKLKLMGMLKDKNPKGNTVELPDGSTIAGVLQRLEIPPENVNVFTVNGRLVRHRDHVLLDGDELTILPPVGGG